MERRDWGGGPNHEPRTHPRTHARTLKYELQASKPRPLTMKMKPRLLLPLLGTAATTNAFTTLSHILNTRKVSSPKIRLQALIYEPDGEVRVDDGLDQHVVREGSTAILDYLNSPDFRGPLAVLVAAHGNVDITTIQQVTTIDVSKKTIQLEALCAADETNLVNVRVDVDFPVLCQDESEIIQNLNALHEKASAMLEKKKLEKEQRQDLNVRPVSKVSEEKQAKRIELMELEAKRESYRKQRALLAARLSREAKEREQAAKRKEPEKGALPTEEEDARLAAKAKRQSFVKQRALLEERLQREERIRALSRQTHRGTEAQQAKAEGDQKQPKPISTKERKDVAYSYEGIEDVGELAFAILRDLGMIEITPDPSSPDYDSSRDDVFVE